MSACGVSRRHRSQRDPYRRSGALTRPLPTAIGLLPAHDTQLDVQSQMRASVKAMQASGLFDSIEEYTSKGGKEPVPAVGHVSSPH
jgi:hypothetical protein